jgi:hypothetical protein
LVMTPGDGFLKLLREAPLPTDGRGGSAMPAAPRAP